MTPFKRLSSPFSNTFTAMGVPLGVCALKMVACPPRLHRFPECEILRRLANVAVLRCGGGEKQLARKRVLGAGMTTESASVGADASANMNAADGRVAAMVSGIAATVDDPFP